MKRTELEQAEHDRDGFALLALAAIFAAFVFGLLFFKALEQQDMWRDKAQGAQKKHIEEIQRDANCHMKEMESAYNGLKERINELASQFTDDDE